MWQLQPTPEALLTAPGRALVELKQILSFRRMTVGSRQRMASLATDPVGAAAAVRAWGARARSSRVDRCPLSTERDDLGRHLPKVRWRLTPLDRHTIQRSQQLLVKPRPVMGMPRSKHRFLNQTCQSKSAADTTIWGPPEWLPSQPRAS